MNKPETDISSIRGNTKTTYEEWLSAAQNTLINEGAERVKIDRLAKNLGVSRGGFYWFFKNRQDILDQLLVSWEDPNQDPLTCVLINPNQSPFATLLDYTKIFAFEEKYKPDLDSAIRDWARTSDKAKKAVQIVDDRRINALTHIFEGLDNTTDEAFIRARIYYFHQVGYYTLDLQESPEQRLQYLPIYFKQLTGFELPIEVLQELSAINNTPHT